MIGLVKGKNWGTTQCIFCDNNVEISRIVIEKGGYCSRHSHTSKHNLFFIESGKLAVNVYNDNDIVDRTVLSSQMATSVEPGVVHEFEALEDTIAYEIYWVKLGLNDITRLSVGGIKLPILEP